ncbi:MAG TPA: hypothetical protein VHA12_03090 [Candidatus Nanoarchaeia archaeon]|nr:hypothetical protein [Candidatus Nanoarchaeia archaeon]
MPLYDYHCKKCDSYREYLVPNPNSDPLICLDCDKVGGLERKAIQCFSVGSTSKPSTLSPEDQLRAMNAKKIATSTAIFPISEKKALLRTRTYYAIPDPSSN